MKNNNLTLQENKKIFVGIDLVKLICAILVVYTHTYCFDLGKVGLWIKDMLSPIGVPFFFITSGFFFSKGLRDAKDAKQYFRSYLVRVVRMYFIWGVITLPAAYYNISIAHAEYTFVKRCVYLLRCVVFAGNIGVYWYLLALIYNSIILFVVFKYDLVKFVFPISIVLFVIGVLYQADCLPIRILTIFIHVVFGSERNFLNVGLFYMVLGYMMATKNVINIKLTIVAVLFVLVIAVATLIRQITSLQFMQAFAAILLFLLALQIRTQTLEKYSLNIRKLSTAIYLEHFPFILLFDYYLTRGTLLDFSVTLLFSILLYIAASKMLPSKWIRILYGN